MTSRSGHSAVLGSFIDLIRWLLRERMDHAKRLLAMAAELKALAESTEDDVVYDELIIVANVCTEAAAAIELHAKDFAA